MKLFPTLMVRAVLDERKKGLKQKMNKAGSKTPKILLIAENCHDTATQIQLAAKTHPEFKINLVKFDLKHPDNTVREILTELATGDYTHIISEFFFRNPTHNFQKHGPVTEREWGFKLLDLMQEKFPQIIVCFRSILGCQEVNRRLENSGSDLEDRVFNKSTPLNVILETVIDDKSSMDSGARPGRNTPPRTHRNLKVAGCN